MDYRKVKSFLHGQSLLDFILGFVMLGILVVGITRIWVWFNVDYARRESAYQRGRNFTGLASSYNASNPSLTGPVEVGGSGCPGCRNLRYAHLDLTEDWAFRGIPFPSRTWDFDNPPQEVVAFCTSQCNNQPQCNSTGQGNFNDDCLCFMHCVCQKMSERVLDNMNQTEGALRFQANNLTETANDMYAKINSGCSEPWQLCWWGGALPKSSQELKYTADDLTNQSSILNSKADRIYNDTQNLKGCCDNDTMDNAPPDNLIEPNEINNTTACLDGLGKTCRDIVDDSREDYASRARQRVEHIIPHLRDQWNDTGNWIMQCEGLKQGQDECCERYNASTICKTWDTGGNTTQCLEYYDSSGYTCNYLGNDPHGPFQIVGSKAYYEEVEAFQDQWINDTLAPGAVGDCCVNTTCVNPINATAITGCINDVVNESKQIWP